MKRSTRLIAQPTRLIFSTLALAALGACGGGGGGSTPEPVAAAPATTTFSGVLRDANTKQALSGATVSVAVKDSATPTTATSGADGAFNLRVETSKLNTASSVVLAVMAPSYKPCAAEVKDLSSLGGTKTMTDCVDLSAVPAGTFVPAEGMQVVRLGDGSSGTAAEANNTQLSTLQAGTSKEIKIGAVNATTAGSNLGFSLKLKIRGLEASCANRISIYQTPSAPLLVANGGAGGALVSSDVRGEFSSYEFRLAVSALARTGDLFVKLESGACGAAPAEQRDDFEFYDVVGSFTPALPPT